MDQASSMETNAMERFNYRPVTEALRDLAYILDHLHTKESVSMGIFITEETTSNDPAVVHFYPTVDQVGPLVQAVNRAAETRLAWEEDILSTPSLILWFGKYLELSMEVKCE